MDDKSCRRSSTTRARASSVNCQFSRLSRCLGLEHSTLHSSSLYSLLSYDYRYTNRLAQVGRRLVAGCTLCTNSLCLHQSYLFYSFGFRYCQAISNISDLFWLIMSSFDPVLLNLLDWYIGSDQWSRWTLYGLIISVFIFPALLHRSHSQTGSRLRAYSIWHVRHLMKDAYPVRLGWRVWLISQHSLLFRPYFSL